MAKNTTPEPRKPRRLRRFLLIALLLLILLVAFAPTIIANTFLRNSIARSALSDIKGDIEIGSATFGWFAPPTLENVTITDEQGNKVVTIEKIVGTKSLWTLLWNQSDLGTLRCERPLIHVVCGKEKTNLESVFACFLESSETESSSESPTLKLELVEGRINIHEASTKKDWVLSSVNCTVAIAKSEDPVEILLTSKITEGKSPAPSSLMAEASIRGESGKFKLKSKDLPLSLAQALGQRFEKSLRTDGTLSCSLAGNWNGNNAQIQGNLSAQDLYLAGDFLGGDRIQMKSLNLPCQARLNGSTISIEKAQLTCDVGTASIQGKLDTSKSVSDLVTQPGYEVKVDLDLARLAKLLPSTLQLKEGTEITGGRLVLDLRSEEHLKGVAWKANLKTSGLQGKRAGQVLSWKEPLTLDLAAHQEGKEIPVLDRLECKSSFLTLNGSGNTKHLFLKARTDLDRLARELSQFVDLGETKLRGQSDITLTLVRENQNALQIGVTGNVSDVHVALSGFKPLQEKEIAFHLGAAGTYDAEKSLASLAAGRATIVIGEDRLEARLLKPIDDLSKADVDQAFVRIKGDLTRWRLRAGRFVDGLESLNLTGDADLTGTLKIEPSKFKLKGAKLIASSFAFQTEGFHLREPDVRLTADIEFDEKHGKLALLGPVLVCPTFKAESQKLEYLLTSKSSVPVAGKLKILGTLAGVHAWLPSKPTSFKGVLQGTLDLKPNGEQTRVSIDASVKNFVFGSPKDPIWAEPVLVVRGDLGCDFAKDLLQIHALNVNGEMLALKGQGRLASLSEKLRLSVAGQMTYDLQKLQAKFVPDLGKTVKLTAPRTTKPFRFDGSLAEGIQAWLAETELAWTSLKTLGCDGGAAVAKTKIDSGWVHLGPVSCALNQGQLYLQPKLRLSPDPLELHIAPGTILNRARLTPEMCNDVIKYAIPALAGITEGRGELSMQLQDCRMPLGNLSKASIRGAVKIHSAVIQGNPLIQQLSTLLAKRPAQVALKSESQVSFRMRDGWVEHRGVQIVFPRLTVTTYGAVHVSGRLSMIAEFPVPEKWLGNGRLTKLLSQKKIRVPISGTVDRPRLDQNVLKRESAAVLREATQNLIRDTLDSKLRKLFDRK